MRSLRPETIAAQAGGGVDGHTGALVPPIHIATTFVRDADNQYRRGFCYGRSDNATVRQVEGGKAAAVTSAARLQVWKRATSLGGVESLVEHRSSMEGDTSPCPADLLRFSVGIENIEDLIGDIAQALPRS